MHTALASTKNATPRVVDNDRDEITVTLDGKELRGWSYASEAERRTKMLLAREFVEGWFQASKREAALVAAIHEGRRAIGEHSAPHDCYATGPVTGDTFRDLVQCPACSFIAAYDTALASQVLA